MAILIIRTPYTPAATSSNDVNSWLADAESPSKFKQRVMSGGLLLLNDADRALVLAYAGRVGILHEAASSKDKDSISYILSLQKGGMDLKTIDANGRSIIALDDLLIERHIALHAIGAPFIHPELSHLEFILGKFNGPFTERENNPWEKLVPGVLNSSTKEELLNLRSDTYNQCLFTYLLKHPSDSENFFKRFLQWQKEAPEEAATLLIRFVSNNLFYLRIKEVIRLILWMIDEKKITPRVIEVLYTNPRACYHLLQHPEIYKFLDLGVFSADFYVIYGNTQDERLSMWCLSLQRAKNLDEAWDILVNLKEVASKDKISPFLTSFCLTHVEKLEVQENKTIWSACNRFSVSDEDLEAIIDLGFDPNKLDSDFRNFVFYFKVPEFLKGKVKVDGLDIYSRNALEHTVWNAIKSQKINCRYIKHLCKLGLRLSKVFPYVDVCEKIFPSDYHKKAILIFLLLTSNKTAIKSIKSEGGYEDVLKAAKEFPKLKPLIDKLDRPAKYSYRSPETMLADIQFDQNVISGSKAASYFIAGLQRVLPLEESRLLLGRLSLRHDEIVLLFRFLSINPPLFSAFIKWPQKLHVGTNGSHKSQQERIVLSLLYSLDTQIRETDWKQVFPHSNHLNATLVPESSHERKEDFISANSQGNGFVYLPNSKMHRTLLRKFNSLKFFEGIRDQFVSQIPIPGKFHVFRTVPREHEGIHSPAIAFSFSGGAFGSIFEQTAAHFEKAQMACLKDAGHMIANGLVPQLVKARLSEKHNWKTFRVFSELFDSKEERIVQIGKQNYRIPPSDFLRPMKLEISVAGLSHPEHQMRRLKSLSYSHKEGWQFLDQMEGLGRTLVIALLNRIEYGKRNKPLKWNEDGDCRELLVVFKKYLNRLLSGFFGKTFEVQLEFSLKLAQQILFWTDESENGFQSWLSKGELPEGLYSNDVEVDVTKCDDPGVMRGILGWVDFKENIRAIFLQAVAMNDLTRDEMPVKYYGDSYPGDA